MIDNDKSNEIYAAIRKAYGYDDHAQELIDYVMDLLDAVEKIDGLVEYVKE